MKRPNSKYLLEDLKSLDHHTISEELWRIKQYIADYEAFLPDVEELAQIIFEDKTYLDLPISKEKIPIRTIERCRELAKAIHKRLKGE